MKDSQSFIPDVGDVCLYKEIGGLNWCLCKVIAKYEGKIWMHNYYTGSMPVKRFSSVEFKKTNP